MLWFFWKIRVLNVCCVNICVLGLDLLIYNFSFNKDKLCFYWILYDKFRGFWIIKIGVVRIFKVFYVGLILDLVLMWNKLYKIIWFF